MKLTNFAVIFIFIFLALSAPNHVHFQEVATVSDLKERYTNAMETAVDDAMNSIVESDNGAEVSLNKEFLLDQFYKTLFINLGCTSDSVKQEAIKNYIPVVLLVDKDGYYIYYSATSKDAYGTAIIGKNWSDKLPFTYTEENGGRVINFTLNDNVTIYDPNTNEVFNGDYHDLAKLNTFSVDDSDHNCYKSSLLCGTSDNFDMIRRNTIINCLTKSMEYYINLHNSVAEQFGFTYHFSLPYISDDDWARTIDDISMVALFQGYPYVSDNPDLGYFNIYSIGGARIIKSSQLYITKENGTLYYHKKSCHKLENVNSTVFDQPYEDARACAKKGAFPCPECNP